jgi:hypothetical protein
MLIADAKNIGNRLKSVGIFYTPRNGRLTVPDFPNIINLLIFWREICIHRSGVLALGVQFGG